MARWLAFALVSVAVVAAACTPTTVTMSTSMARPTGTTETTTTGVGLAQGIPVSPATIGPPAPVDTNAPMATSWIDSDEVVLITADNLNLALVEALSMSTSEMLDSIDAPHPWSIEAVFSLFDDIHAVVSYGDGQKAHVVVGDHPRSTFSAEQPWLDVRYGRRDDSFPIVEIAWLGLPEDASYVVADYIGIDDVPDMENLAQQVIASSSFTAIPKPSWTQYVLFTAFDEAGQAIASTEVLIDGGTCSAHDLSPMDNPELPPPVDEARRSMFSDAGACDYVGLAESATDDGVYFGVSRDALAAELRTMDRRFPIMRAISDALLFRAITETRDGGTVYVFDTASGLEIVLDENGRWISARL